MSSSTPTAAPDIQPPVQYTPADLVEALRLLENWRQQQHQTSQVRVEQLAEVADPASIPTDMADYFAARGLRVAMASVLPREMARLARFQRVPLRITDVPDKDRKLFQGWLEQGGFREVAGHYLHGDTCIYKQPIRQFENLGFDAYNRWANMQTDPNVDAAAIHDTIDGQVRHGAKVIALGADPDDAGGRPLIPGAVRR